MSAAWRLAINSLSGRRLRTGLLATAVALATALVVAVGCAIASLNAAMELRLETTIGSADGKVKHVGGRPFEASVLESVLGWEEVRIAAPRAQGAVPLINPKTGATEVAVGIGGDPELEFQIHRPNLTAGRAVARDGEIMIETRTARKLSVGVGDRVHVHQFGPVIELEVVGVTLPSPMAQLQRPVANLSLATLSEITGTANKLSSIFIELEPDEDAMMFAQRRTADLPEGIAVHPTVRVSSGLGNNVKSFNLALIVISIITFLGASFIVLTGLTTNVIEKQRELAIVRCIGGSVGQIGWAQLFIGAIVGVIGALAGLPIGVFLAWVATVIFPEQLQAGLRLSGLGLTLALCGAMCAGLLGASWPAILAGRTSPLTALASRAKPPSKLAIPILTVAGLLLIFAQYAMAFWPDDVQISYWLTIGFGLAAMYTGYFLLGPPVSRVLGHVIGPALSRMLRLPKGLLEGALDAKPIRHGLTAGSLMVGVAVLTQLWTEGSAITRDWVGAINFPDAFVHGLQGLTPEDRARVDALPFVEETSAITLVNVENDTFGIRAINQLGTHFIAFEPESFLRMTNLQWIEGDPAYAAHRLSEGGAICVAREFKIAGGYSVGDTFSLKHEGQAFDFEIVGVFTSPGLELASRYFDIGDQYYKQSLHAVFGSRKDLIEKFKNDAIHMIQVDLADDVDDEQALNEMRKALGNTLLTAGSGREIKSMITSIGESSMKIIYVVALAAVVMACFGVGNIVIAGIDARRFEFGVLRAIGAEGKTLMRLVLAEVIVIALAACVLGTATGLQGAATGLMFQREVLGLSPRFIAPIGPIAIGWAMLISLTLLAAAPAAVALARRAPRELLAATRG